MKAKHYLVSLTLLGRGANLHGYVMGAGQRVAEQAASRVMDEAEKLGAGFAPMGMITPLTGPAVELVREVFAAISPDIARTIAEATDYHLSIVGTSVGSPADARLMELH